ncbi:MAG: hypothetical protein FWF08_04440 [Oscillospiraceae bacterium]|nr:hypothetical protein [Oscillospiraceae bacterium]
MAIKKIWNNYKYELIIFGALALGLCVEHAKSGAGRKYVFSLYLMDYSIGFVSKAFIGSIVSLFVNNYTENLILNIAWCAVLLLFGLLALLLGRLIKKAEKEDKIIIIFLAAFLFLCKIYFTDIIYVLFGYYDIFWLILTLLSVAALRYKKLKWLIPVFCLCAVFINEGYIFLAFGAVFLLLLYETVKKPSKNNILLTAVTSGSVLLSTIYFTFFSYKMIKYTSVDELYEYALAKLPVQEDLFYRNYGSYYFHLSATDYVPDLSRSYFWNVLKYTYEISTIKSNMLFFLFTALLSIVFICFWISIIKKQKRNISKLYYFSCTLFAVTLIPLVFLTSDSGRVCMHFVFSQSLLLFYFYYDKNKSVTANLSRLCGNIIKNPLLIILLLVLISVINIFQIGM